MEDVREEESQPDTFAASFASDAIHPVVPVANAHERKPMRTARERPVDRARAVLVHGPALARVFGENEALVLAGIEERPSEKSRALVENRRIAGRGDVERRDVGKPEQIVAKAGANPLAERRMPP